MKEEELYSYEDFVRSFAKTIDLDYPEANSLISQKIKEHGLTETDIVIFLNCVQRNLPCLDVAKALDISISSVQYRLKKTRERFPALRVYNKNLPRRKPFKNPKRYSTPTKEIVQKHQSFNEEIHCIVDKEFEHRQLDGKSVDDNQNQIKRKF